MINKTVSIIVPAYNAAKYIKRQLYSIIGQSYKDIQIIIIDDGSTDNTLDICKEISLQDDRVEVYHQENKGVSAARNYGLNLIHSEFVIFFDADDEVAGNMIEAMISNIGDADMIYCGYKLYRNDVYIREYLPPQKTLNIEEAYKNLLTNREFHGSLWNKMFRTTRIMVDGSFILFDEDISYREDKLWVAKVLKNCKCIKSLNISPYKWYVKEGGLSAKEGCGASLDGMIASERIVIEAQSVSNKIYKIALNDYINWIRQKEVTFNIRKKLSMDEIHALANKWLNICKDNNVTGMEYCGTLIITRLSEAHFPSILIRLTNSLIVRVLRFKHLWNDGIIKGK